MSESHGGSQRMCMPGGTERNGDLSFCLQKFYRSVHGKPIWGKRITS